MNLLQIIRFAVIFILSILFFFILWFFDIGSWFVRVVRFYVFLNVPVNVCFLFFNIVFIIRPGTKKSVQSKAGGDG